MSQQEQRPPIPDMPPREERQKPYADVYATFDRDHSGRHSEDADDSNLEMVEVGAAWATKRGNISLELKVEPLKWRNPNCPRRLLLVLRRDR